MEIVFHLQGPADTPLRKAQLFTSMDTQRFKSIIDGVDQKSKQWRTIISTPILSWDSDKNRI